MIKFHFIIAFRNFLKNKEFKLINTVGLAVGIMSVLFIFLWIRDELSYDRFHKHSDRIYRIAWFSERPQTRTPHPMTHAMVKDFPEVENAVSLTPVFGAGLTRVDRLVKYGEKQFEESGIYAADTTFFDVFSFPLLQGDPDHCLDDVGSIVITRSMAEKYFGDEDPMGKILTIDFERDIAFNVKGVMEDIPANSHFHFDFLFSYVTYKHYHTGSFFEWEDFGHYNYLLLKEGADPGKLTEKILPWITEYLDVPESYKNRLEKGEIGFRFQPLERIHLHSNLLWELEPNGDISYVYIFTFLGIFILLIACINYVNLSTANAGRRFTEIGIKKVNGASSTSLKVQFLVESILTAFIGLILAVILFEIISPVLSNVAQKQFVLDYSRPSTLGGLIGMGFIIGLLAGMIPAQIMSGMSPLSTLKGGHRNLSKRSLLRNLLVVFQFAISIFLIIGTLVITRQIDFLREKKLGFNSDQILVINIQDTLMRQNYESVKSELLTNNKIMSVSAVSNIPGRRFNQNPVQWPAADEPEACSQVRVDHDFINTLDLELVAGRDFSKDRPADLYDAFIINETAVKLFDWESPVGEELIWYDDDVYRRGKVIGIVRDFHFQSLHSSIEPLIMHVNPESFNYLMVKIAPQDVQATISYLENKYHEVDPNHSFRYFFLDEDFAAMYAAETRMQKVGGYFTVLALIISCIGLFGLSTYAAERRTKELGIRKVNGASTFSLIRLMTKDFTIWIVVAFVIAAPLSGYVMNRWLDNFAYKVEPSWLLYMIAGGTALLIAWVTVSFQSWKAACKNPVEVLRYE